METIREQLSVAQEDGRLVAIFRYGDEDHFF